MINITHQTKPISANDIVRHWHLVDAKNVILGRLATQISVRLTGKTKPGYSQNLDTGDYVVVTNASMIKLSGNKKNSKTYSRYSGYPGGLKLIPFMKIFSTNPTKIIKIAVRGMLPKNKLNKIRLMRLYVYPGDKHPHLDKIKSIS